MDRALKRRIATVVGALVGANVLALAANAVVSFAFGNVSAGDGSLFSYGILAWLLGLRHACDADHIAAIDNTTRRLALLNRESVFIGGYFALGHSTIVAIMCLVVAVSSAAASQALTEAGDIAGIVGTCVSLGFLCIIGFANVWVLTALIRRRRRLLGAALPPPADDDDDELTQDELLLARTDDDTEKERDQPGGCFTRCCPTLLRAVDRPHKMYFVGFVFGLGFDTATEVSLLAITAVTSAQSGWVFAPLFALLFASGMTLIDTLDGILVRWAIDRVTAERQLFFNIGVTALATLLAVIAALMQVMSLVVSAYPDDGSRDTPFIGFWRALPSEYVGMFFIGLFVTGVLALVVGDRVHEHRKRAAVTV